MKHSRYGKHRKINKERKIPHIEQTLRWVDILCWFDYSDTVRDCATNLVYSYYMDKVTNKPSLIAAACLYLADGKWAKDSWKFEKIKKIMLAKRAIAKKGKLILEPHFDANIRPETIIKLGDTIEDNKQDRDNKSLPKSAREEQ